MSEENSKKNNVIDCDFENWKMAWKCRDFELSHLWQRSIFITAFIIAVFAAYVAMWLNFMEIINSAYGIFFYKVIANSISVLIALIGYILSILYIMMGKGSKYWYECYEGYILSIENGNNNDKKLDVSNVEKHIEKSRINNSIFSTSAGKYSVSRINILLGIISSAIFAIITVIHIVILIYLWCRYKTDLNSGIEIFIGFSILVGLVFLVCMPCCLKDKASSKN